jgi:hypothetical protein
MTRQLKDVGEYFDQAQRMWERHGCDAEPLLPSGQLFEYELNERGKYTGRGHLSGRISFPEWSDAYLSIEDWLQPRRGYIVRQSYAYDLIFRGDRLENWHRHHGTEHRHDGHERRPISRVTLEEAIKKSRDVLARGAIPPED